jgi:adenosylhomocysteine nucleosidase
MSYAHPLVCFALKEESKPFAQTAASLRVRTLITGIGRMNAERATRAALAESRPNLVLTCGFAGGLNPDLILGDVVFSADDSEFRTPNSALRTRLLAASAREVKFFCADRIAVTAEEKWSLWQKTGADAMEMESEIIRAVCREQGIPSATLRVISDVAGEDMPLDFNVLLTQDMELDSGKLVLAVAKSPGKIGRLLRLQKQTAAAARRLAAVLEVVVA